MDYETIPAEISFIGFNFSQYHTHEQTILKPQFEKLGFSQVTFTMGERDSLGPLSRIIHATKDGKRHHYVYG